MKIWKKIKTQLEGLEDDFNKNLLESGAER